MRTVFSQVMVVGRLTNLLYRKSVSMYTLYTFGFGIPIILLVLSVVSTVVLALVNPNLS